MPSLEAACPDILPLVRAVVPWDILALEPVVLVSAPACALASAAADPFSAAQEGVAAAKAIAPTTPSMSGSFITALFMVAPPVLHPTMGHGRATTTKPFTLSSLQNARLRTDFCHHDC